MHPQARVACLRRFRAQSWVMIGLTQSKHFPGLLNTLHRVMEIGQRRTTHGDRKTGGKR